MTRRLLLILSFLLFGGPALAQAPISQADRAEIRRVITDQMAAFRRDDASAAFAFAAPTIQGMFGTPERFMGMVRGGYEPVYRPSNVQFGTLDWINGELIQIVALDGPDGRPAIAIYTMQQQPDGSWRIAGCSLAEPPGTST